MQGLGLAKACRCESLLLIGLMLMTLPTMSHVGEATNPESMDSHFSCYCVLEHYNPVMTTENIST